MHDLLEEKLEMDTSNITIERTHCVGEKPDDKIQFSFYKDEINSLKNCKKLKETKISIFEDFSQDTCKFVKVRFRTSSIEVLFARKDEHQHN